MFELVPSSIVVCKRANCQIDLLVVGNMPSKIPIEIRELYTSILVAEILSLIEKANKNNGTFYYDGPLKHNFGKNQIIISTSLMFETSHDLRRFMRIVKVE